MSEEITTARLKEWAAGCDMRAKHPSPDDMGWFLQDVAVALRMAADQLTGKSIRLLSRTAQRDQYAALLRRALNIFEFEGRAPDLAAEIDAALKETDQ